MHSVNDKVGLVRSEYAVKAVLTCWQGLLEFWYSVSDMLKVIVYFFLLEPLLYTLNHHKYHTIILSAKTLSISV